MKQASQVSRLHPCGARNEHQLVRAKRGPHSAKPEEVRYRIERMFPEQPKIELFARREVAGWAVWGLDVGAEPERRLLTG